MKRPVVAPLAGAAALTLATVAGGASAFHHSSSTAATRTAAAAAQDHLRAVCSQQAAWAQRGEAFVTGVVRGHGRPVSGRQR